MSRQVEKLWVPRLTCGSQYLHGIHRGESSQHLPITGDGQVLNGYPSTLVRPSYNKRKDNEGDDEEKKIKQQLMQSSPIPRN